MKFCFINLVVKISLLIAIICTVNAANAQDNRGNKASQQNYYKGMRYGLFTPVDYNSKVSYPMIVYLHGSTDTVSRELSWYHDVVQKNHPCFVLSPKTTEPNQGWGNTWEKKHTVAMENALSLLDSLVAEYNIDKNRLYIYGISMGAFGTFSVLSNEPGKFAGAYAVCGGSDISIASKITTPLWIFHGAEDDVVPVRLSKNMYDEMVLKGNKTVRYTEYPAVRHNSWENVSREKTLAKWLLSQQRGSISDVPNPVNDVTVKKLYNSTARIEWIKPTRNDSDDEIWYYKIFRDDKLIAEIDGDLTEFNDYKYNSTSSHNYYVVSVNYFFRQSKPSPIASLE